MVKSNPVLSASPTLWQEPELQETLLSAIGVGRIKQIAITQIIHAMMSVDSPTLPERAYASLGTRAISGVLANVDRETFERSQLRPWLDLLRAHRDDVLEWLRDAGRLTCSNFRALTEILKPSDVGKSARCIDVITESLPMALYVW